MSIKNFTYNLRAQRPTKINFKTGQQIIHLPIYTSCCQLGSTTKEIGSQVWGVVENGGWIRALDERAQGFGRASLEPIANKLREAGARLFSFIQDKKSIIVGRACAPPTGKGKRSAGGVPIRNGRSSASRLQFLSTGKSTLSSLLFSRRPRPALSKTRATRTKENRHTRERRRRIEG